MPIKLAINLIHEFRDKVNAQPIFRELFKNVDGKNKWNVICSAMDWITVTSEGLPKINLDFPFGLGNNSLESLNVMQYVISVDLLTESIVQIFRVIDGKNSYPLDEDREVFKQSVISDDRYFKHIRAVFGTHPVNLDSLDGLNKKVGERFYASWTTKDFLGEDDYLVYLYSNDPENDTLNPFRLNIQDINRYAEKRYELLHLLIQKVDNFLVTHTDVNQHNIIPYTENTLEQLGILFEENKKRFGVSYGYSSTISYLHRMLSVNISPTADIDLKMIDDYRQFLVTLIPNIKDGLQKVDSGNLEWGLAYTGYEFEKIYAYLYDQEHPIGKGYFTQLINKGCLPTYLLMCDNFNEKELVFDATLYQLQRKLSRSVTYQDFDNLRN